MLSDPDKIYPGQMLRIPREVSRARRLLCRAHRLPVSANPRAGGRRTLAGGRMIKVATLADKRAIEAEMPVEDRWSARSLYEQVADTAGRFPDRPAMTFQLKRVRATRR